MAGRRLCHFGDRCNKGSACPFVHLNTNQTSQDGIFQRPSRQSSRPPENPFGPLPNQGLTRPRHQSVGRSTIGFRPPSSTSYPAYKSRGLSTNRDASSATGQLPNTRGPCRFGAACRNQPACPFDHSVTDQAIPTASGPSRARSRPPSASRFGRPTEQSELRKCWFGPACRNQPSRPFDHTSSDERTSSSIVAEYLEQFQEEYQVMNRLSIDRIRHWSFSFF